MIYRIAQCLVIFAAISYIVMEKASADSIKLAGQPQVLFAAKTSSCSKNFIPDSPLRAFKRADGKIELIASHYENWMLSGPSVSEAKISCASVMSLHRYAKAGIEGQIWLQATYTKDGKIVYALGSQDLTTRDIHLGCDPHGSPGHCWINQIIAAYSTDMGNKFEPSSVVASLGDKYSPAQRHQFGYFTASNIVHWQNFYYVILYYTLPDNEGTSGNCLFQTSDVADPTSWRGWNGTSFAVDPATQHFACSPVVPASDGPVRSLSFVSEANYWIALTAGRHKLDGSETYVPGFYTLSSKDLIHWDGPHLLKRAPLAARVDSSSDVLSYPSLIDPQSKSRNFDTLDHRNAWLFWTDHHLKNGSGTLDRDLDYIQVDLY